MQKMTRRAALAAIPAMGAVATVPAMAKPALSPDERIEAAIEDLKAAVKAKLPDAAIYVREVNEISRLSVMVMTDVGDQEAGTVKHERAGLAYGKPTRFGES